MTIQTEKEIILLNAKREVSAGTVLENNEFSVFYLLGDTKITKDGINYKLCHPVWTADLKKIRLSANKSQNSPHTWGCNNKHGKHHDPGKRNRIDV